jgi:hypothetical protein
VPRVCQFLVDTDVATVTRVTERPTGERPQFLPLHRISGRSRGLLASQKNGGIPPIGGITPIGGIPPFRWLDRSYSSVIIATKA